MDRRLLAALALSLLIHFAAVSGPGWRLPLMNDEPGMSVTLQAQIAQPRPQAAAPPRPVQPKARKPRLAPVRDAAPVAPAAPMPEQPAAAEPAPAPIAAQQPAAPIAAAPVEITLPRQGRIRFVVTRGEGEQGMQLGESVHSWRHDGTSYALQAVTETTGLVALFRPVKVVLSSEGTIGAAGLVPREYRAERNGQAAEAARLDPESMRVVLSDAGRVRREAAMTEGAQDLLSHLYQLGLMGAPARVEMMIATGKNYSRYVFELVDAEKLATRFGVLRALHYRTLAGEGEQTTEFWLTPEHRNLPLRIRHIDRKGDIFDQTAVEIEIDGTGLAERAE
ncbi:MAG: hypothetical protein C0522_00135 [Rhodocyclaceae bacterium]|jgi:hypothetical protein|nr:hypothetical protein [Rhodocyclaceae bacterium]